MKNFQLREEELAELRAAHRGSRDKRSAYRLNAVILPTATKYVLGQEKWSAGPAALVVRLGNSFDDPSSIEGWKKAGIRVSSLSNGGISRATVTAMT